MKKKEKKELGVIAFRHQYNSWLEAVPEIKDIYKTYLISSAEDAMGLVLDDYLTIGEGYKLPNYEQVLMVTKMRVRR